MSLEIDIHVIELSNLPSEAPPWAVHLQRDMHAAIRLLIAVLRKQELLQKELKMTDRSVDEVIALAQDEKTQIAGFSAILQALKDQVANLPGMSAENQAKVNALFDQVTENDNAVKALNAINSGTDGDGTDPSAPADGGS